MAPLARRRLAYCVSLLAAAALASQLPLDPAQGRLDPSTGLVDAGPFLFDADNPWLTYPKGYVPHAPRSAGNATAGGAGAERLLQPAPGAAAQLLTHPSPVNYDAFGYSVALSADGSRVAVGAYQKDVGPAVSAGVVYTFTGSAAAGWALEATLTAPAPAGGVAYGTAVL